MTVYQLPENSKIVLTLVNNRRKDMIHFQKYSSLVGRIFISLIFLVAGLSKISGYDATQAYMQAMGVNEQLLILVIITEVLGAIAIIIGYKTRLAAFLLAGFSILAAILFHADFSDQMQSILFMKNIAISGGLLLIVSHGAGYLSVDNWLAKKQR